MAKLIPFNRRYPDFFREAPGNFYNVLDDFFGDVLPSFGGFWPASRNLMRDTFKIDVKETDKEYSIEAELPGVSKEELNLSLNEGSLCISVSKDRHVDESNKDCIHKERRISSMSRSIYLPDAKPEEVKAKLNHGLLAVTVQKQDKPNSSISIDIE
ncbi:heat-shock protein Hsp20 [Clostridia bacterium]|nr:heat-shock protein Hsp20 [Clostridia bacterium]